MSVKIVAEAGCNHQGDMKIAREMIKAAAEAGADYIKFQKRDLDDWLEQKPEWDEPHPCGNNAFGKTYYEHRRALEFDYKQHLDLWSVCWSHEIGYACSAWDTYSAKQLVEEINPDYIKIPSACNNNDELSYYLYNNYGEKIHISLGMTTDEEYDNMIIGDCYSRFIFYHCTSGYPVPFEQLYLNEILNIKHNFSTNTIDAEVGYSGHHLGIAADIAAVALGATWIERHFTLDRTMKGTDHSASLEPSGLTKLVRDIRAVEKALAYKEKDISDIEIEQRRKLKWQQ
jgi:N-acetylneuraminate synthase